MEVYRGILRRIAEELAGVPRGELAEATGVSPATVANWLSGRTPMRLRDAVDLFAAAGLPPEKLGRAVQIGIADARVEAAIDRFLDDERARLQPGTPEPERRTRRIAGDEKV